MDTESPIWLLGKWYGAKDVSNATHSLPEEVLCAFHADLKSRVWCTYRRDFAPFVGSTLTSDVGWGCTFRSGQMLMAEALSRSMFGRAWTKSSQVLEPEMLSLLALLADNESSVLSLHNLCTAGREYGVVAGKWLGPWVLCKALAALVNSTRPSGLQVHVVCDPGGGAPELDVANIRLLFTQSQQQHQQQAQPPLSPTSSFSQPGRSSPSAVSSPLQSIPADGSSELDSNATASSNSDEIQNGYSHCVMDSPAEPAGLHTSSPILISAQESQPHRQHMLATAVQTGMGSWNDIGFMSSVPACIREQQHHTDPQQHNSHSQGLPQKPDQSIELGSISVQARQQPQVDSIETHDCASNTQGTSRQHPGAALSGSSENVDATAHALRLLQKPHSSNGQVHGQPRSDSSVDSWHDMRSSPEESQSPGPACISDPPHPCVAGDVLPQRHSGSQNAQGQTGTVPLLLLLPLTLGVDKMNPVYHPQLAAALTFPQSVGIVGGRPGASLYFVGTQNDNLLYLDPHEAQPVAKLPEHSHTYFCDTPRLMPIAAMDASLALGFFVNSLDDFADLESRLRELSRVNRAAPLVTLASHPRAFLRSASDVRAAGSGPQPTSLSAGRMSFSSQARTAAASKLGAGNDQSDDWEMV